MPGPASRFRGFTAHPLVRYTLLQVPGWLFLGTLLYVLWSRQWLGAEAAGWVMALWVLKDAVLYPLYRPALTGSTRTGGIRDLVGASGRARTPIDARGLVVVGGEFWRARVAPGQSAIAAGTAIRVTAVDRRVLVVAARAE